MSVSKRNAAMWLDVDLDDDYETTGYRNRFPGKKKSKETQREEKIELDVPYGYGSNIHPIKKYFEDEKEREWGDVYKRLKKNVASSIALSKKLAEIQDNPYSGESQEIFKSKVDSSVYHALWALKEYCKTARAVTGDIRYPDTMIDLVRDLLTISPLYRQYVKSIKCEPVKRRNCWIENPTRKTKLPAPENFMKSIKKTKEDKQSKKKE